MRGRIRKVLSDRRVRLAIAIAWVVTVVSLDNFAHREGADVSALFLAPIAFIGWYYPRNIASVFAATMVLAIVIPDLAFENLPPFGALLELIIFGGTFVSAAIVVNLLALSFRRETSRAHRDPMTGTLNCLHFQERVSAELQRAKRHGHTITVAFIDLDNFKRMNDEFGHMVGDQVLRSIAALIAEELRESDVVGRLGGDEFGILLPETGRRTAMTILERVRIGITRLGSENRWPISASIGAATLTTEMSSVTMEAMIQRADSIMYKAKGAGKDRVLVEGFEDGAPVESSSVSTAREMWPVDA